jgi:hypothetical protein
MALFGENFPTLFLLLGKIKQEKLPELVGESVYFV